MENSISTRIAADLEFSGAVAQSRYAICGQYQIHYSEWGDIDAPVLLMWHGLARTGRDFDVLAGRLAAHWRVICPDTIGRGLSQWAADPARDYAMARYVEVAAQLLDGLGVRRLVWLGTSMGGAIGMQCAATVLRERIDALVVNDIGPELPAAAVARIVRYAGDPPTFARATELEDWLRLAYRPYGWLSDAQWRAMAETSLRRLPDGRVTLHYDPAIVRQLAERPEDYTQWSAYDSLRQPLLLLRGAESDLLTEDIARAMQQRGPRAQRIDFAGCGHAPALNVEAQMRVIARFLGTP